MTAQPRRETFANATAFPVKKAPSVLHFEGTDSLSKQMPTGLSLYEQKVWQQTIGQQPQL